MKDYLLFGVPIFVSMALMVSLVVFLSANAPEYIQVVDENHGKTFAERLRLMVYREGQVLDERVGWLSRIRDEFAGALNAFNSAVVVLRQRGDASKAPVELFDSQGRMIGAIKELQHGIRLLPYSRGVCVRKEVTATMVAEGLSCISMDESAGELMRLDLRVEPLRWLIWFETRSRLLEMRRASRRIPILCFELNQLYEQCGALEQLSAMQILAGAAQPETPAAARAGENGGHKAA